jgi:hypothetical protein
MYILPLSLQDRALLEVNGQEDSYSEYAIERRLRPHNQVPMRDWRELLLQSIDFFTKSPMQTQG